jgi:3-deoxy-D-manno-octulosonic-acid transferase
MNRFLYYCGIGLYTLGIRLAAMLGQPKAKKWWYGRVQWQIKLQNTVAGNTAPLIWVHCASLGEFEQARPILEALRQQMPQHKILLTFFSPSGYEAQKNCSIVDWVSYLPSDQYGAAQQFLDIIQPQQVFFIKYEFWYGYLTTLKKHQIPTYLIAANFRPNQIFFRWYGGFFRQLLFCFETIFVQTPASQQLLAPFQHPSVMVAGDPRLDRVLDIKAQAKNFPKIAQFSTQAATLVAGSTWPPDEALLKEWLLLQPHYQLILVPHEVDRNHLQELKIGFSGIPTAFYSQLDNVNLSSVQVLIIDQIGLLSSIYNYGIAAYIGGGFGLGIHNCLEAVVYDLPLFFGPNYHKFQEAKALIAANIATEIHQAADLAKGLNNYKTAAARVQLQNKIKHYIHTQKGATATILKHLSSNQIPS